MNEKKDNLIIRFLKRFGLIKEYEISKSDMCKNAQSICKHNCDNCAWKENVERLNGATIEFIKDLCEYEVIKILDKDKKQAEEYEKYINKIEKENKE